ncbi:MAG: sugar phosphate nucleotidyltransferase [candidate division Zixibacteria bacterium]|nr:sugar phosphate nucleotidyltransferase [candidate division Zixibacteria bacterium]
MQLVILAGGLATRLFPLTSKVPKSMLEINKRPFLEYQLELLKEYEIKDVLLCLGYKGELIKNYFGDGKKLGVNLSYSFDGEKLLGTAGALKKAYKLLNDNFLLMYGDSYLPYDYRKIEEAFKNSEKLSLMVVYKNQNRFDKSNILIADDLVKVYDKTLKGENLEYIDAGLSILKKEVLSLVPEDEPYDLQELYKILISEEEMLAYEVRQRFYQIGSLEGLEEFKNIVVKTQIRVEKGAKIYDRY